MREVRVTLLLSEDEKGKLDHLVEDRGVTASDVIRLLIQRDWETSQHMTPLERDSAVMAAHEAARGRNPSSGGRKATKKR